ncbi:MAG: hypothetical protein MJ241_06110 [Bacilli bacterium]|nr:hypothetical protein [Bacilli bacterium]
MAKLNRYTYTEGELKLEIVASSKRRADEIIAIENMDNYSPWVFSGNVEYTDIECDMDELESNQKQVAIKKRAQRFARQS